MQDLISKQRNLLYTTKQVKDILQISRNSLYLLIYSGKLKAINVSLGVRRKQWRIKKEDLDEFINQRKINA
jgi:excisionase family DNA binding protein